MNDETAQGKPLRVLHIGKYFPPHPGGMETYLRDLMSVQHRQGITVTALVHSSKATLRDREIEVDALDGTAFHVRLAARWFNIGFIPISPLFWLSALRAIGRFRPDVIHMHHPNSSAIWLLVLPSARRISWIVHWQSDIVTASSGWLVRCCYFFYKPLEQALLKRASIICATSERYLEDSEALNKHASKVKVVPLGLDERRLPDSTSLQPFAKPDVPVVLYLGRLAAYKGLSYLLEAIAELPEVHCWLAGDGSERSALEQQVARLGIRDRVRFIGGMSEEDKWRYLKTADAVTLPSADKNEAFGMVLLEAAHLKKPLVVTDVPGSGTGWVGSNLGAEIVPVADTKALAAGIRDALQNDTAGKTEALKSSSATFNLRQQAIDITAIYRSMSRCP
jgi:rhamnosyl/mannosyltransferase